MSWERSVREAFETSVLSFEFVSSRHRLTGPRRGGTGWGQTPVMGSDPTLTGGRGMRSFVKGLLLLAMLTLLPASALAQASIAGSARDASGAAMPGVTVEA